MADGVVASGERRQSRRPRQVLMTDLEYQACVDACGARQFSPWASYVLLREARKPRGQILGGFCGWQGCGTYPAWWVHKTLSKYICEQCAQEIIAKGAYTVVENLFADWQTDAVLTHYRIREEVEAAKRAISALRAYGAREELIDVLAELARTVAETR